MVFNKILAFLICVLGTQLALPAQECYRLVWSDEFNGSGLPDPANWYREWGGGGNGWGHNELQLYTNNDIDNIYQSNGTLKIKAIKEDVIHNNETLHFTSARTRSKDLRDFKHGRIEARIKVPAGKGLWPAFWMSPTTSVYGAWPLSGEIDILELLGDTPNIARMALHCSTDPGPEINKTYTLSSGSFADDFHVFGIEWEPDYIHWLIDGNVVFSANQNALEDPSFWPFDQDFYIRLNLAVGGDWPGVPDQNTVFPATMEVDYVRVFQKSANCLSFCLLNKNESFDLDLASWNLFSFGSAVGNTTINHKESYTSVVSPGTAIWHLALRQDSIVLEQGNSYTVSFTARANQAKNIALIFSNKAGAQYHYKSYTLGTELLQYTYNFTMINATDALARVSFNMGNSLGNVYLDNFKIYPKGCRLCGIGSQLDVSQAENATTAYFSDDSIQSTSFILLNGDIRYQAVDQITLLPGFDTTLGALFQGSLGVCRD